MPVTTRGRRIRKHRQKRGKRTRREPPVVEVEWDDSSSHQGWENSERASRPVELACTSVGFLVEKTSKRVRISASAGWPDEGGSTAFLDIVTIPRCAVKRIKRVHR